MALPAIENRTFDEIKIGESARLSRTLEALLDLACARWH
jgi:hypothetical protein